MRRRHRFMTGMLAAVAVAVLPFAQSQPVRAAAQPAQPPGLDRLCEGDGPIPASALGDRASVPACSLVDRLVTARPNGRSRGLSVRVPRDGDRIRAFALKPGGSEVLTVSNIGGRIRAEFVDTPAGAGSEGSGTAEAQPRAMAAGCAQDAYAFNHGGRGFELLTWSYNSSTAVARAGLSSEKSLAAVREANRNLTRVQNDCGLGGISSRARGQYVGDTQLWANIDSAANCTAKFPDGENRVSWGPFDPDLTYLALACTVSDSSSDAIYESDIYLASNRGVTMDPPADCDQLYDLESVMTHEWGHAFGLAHVDEGTDGDLTMSPLVTECDTGARTLGLGDYRGMEELYGIVR